MAEAGEHYKRYTEFKLVGYARAVLPTQEKIRSGPDRSLCKTPQSWYVWSFFAGGSVLLRSMGTKKQLLTKPGMEIPGSPYVISFFLATSSPVEMQNILLLFAATFNIFHIWGCISFLRWESTPFCRLNRSYFIDLRLFLLLFSVFLLIELFWNTVSRMRHSIAVKGLETVQG